MVSKTVWSHCHVLSGIRVTSNLYSSAPLSVVFESETARAFSTDGYFHTYKEIKLWKKISWIRHMVFISSRVIPET